MQLELFPCVFAVTPPGIPSLYEQLMSAAATAARGPAQPRHWMDYLRGAGVVRGSATDEVWKEMRRSHPTTWTQGELMARTGRERGAVCWALHYLLHLGVIRKVGSGLGARRQRYLAIPDADVTYTRC